MTSTLPENKDFKFSYQHAVDVGTVGETGEVEWQRVRFIDAVNPQVSPVTVPAQTYEDKGSPNDIKTGESWTLSFNAQQIMVGGNWLPEIAILMAATEPDANGDVATVPVRWYDNPDGARAVFEDDAYSGVATVSVVRGQTGADGQVEQLQFTLTGKGRRAKIAHPEAEAGA